MTKDSRKDSIPVDGTKRVTRSMFVRALATSQFVLQIVEGPDAGREFILTPKPIRIGKALDNDLVLSDESVSKYHAVIEKDPGGWLIRDLESTNGTTLNAIPINEGFIPVRSLIGLGNSTLKLVPANEKSRLPPSEKTEFGSMLGGSLAMREVFALFERFAPTDLPVFINGETGTGKELAAQGLHQQSPRGKNPFVVFDCSAVVSNLVESELFGHEKGAFTGAETSRAGCFEQAQGGTLFIDEIGELPLDLQPKLLRVLETKEVRRVGGNDGRKVDVRIIAATHRDLPQMVQEQKFREDLYYRLAVVKVTLPPLRERLEDIPPIVERMVAQYNENLPRGRTAIEGFEKEALQFLSSREWKGNVRELRNVIGMAQAVCTGGRVAMEDLFFDEVLMAASRKKGLSFSGRTLEEIEREAILATLEEHSWNKVHTSKSLGIAYQTLLNKIRKFGLEKPR